MRTIVSMILGVIIFTGAYALPKEATTQEPKNGGEEFSIEILDNSTEFKVVENGTVEMSSVFIASQNQTDDEFFGTVWLEFGIEDGISSDVYKTNKTQINDIRLADNLLPEEKKKIEKALQDELKIHFNELPKSKIDGLSNSSYINRSAGLNNEAPPIIYTNQPSSLIIIDGEPYYEDLDKRFSKIANAGAFIIKDNKKDIFYMYGGGLWFSSMEALNGWEYIDYVPNRIKRVMKKHARELYDNMQNEQYQARVVPEIIIANQPAELISTDGSPKFVLIPNTSLLYVENTDAELFRDVTTNKFYSLFSGRWFVSEKLERNWEYLAAEDLPADFMKIPENHDKGNVLVSVPGTKAAENAVRDAQIPNVTKKDISASLNTKVNYDGQPDFSEIEGTGLLYAINTSSAVIQWNNKYYLVDDAVWYNSENPFGPWKIATHRPEGVENIPASNPLFNVKYVYVYKNTDRVVYTGFTSGYTGSYVYGPTVVFGTGFHYHGWYGHLYYHHPMTYGYGFFYDPFYGWVPVYSSWYRPSFYWHWHWRYWYGYRPPHYRPPHHRPPSGVKPTQPIERPGRPERPTTLPAEPGTRPAQPAVRPAQPSQLPSQPDVRPTQPSNRPSVRPTQPSNRPTVRPTQPASRPSQPAIRPSQPAARPSPGPAQMR